MNRALLRRLPVTLMTLALLLATTSFGAVGSLHTVTVSGKHKQLSDISYNPQTEKYLVVWQEDYGGGDWDIVGEVLSKDGSVLFGPFSIAATTDVETQPRVARANTTTWAVTWVRNAALLSTIMACRVEASGSCQNYTTVESSLGICANPDIGGTPVLDQYLLVWDQVNLGGIREVRGKQFSALIGAIGSTLTIGNSVLNDRSNPSVNQLGNNFLVAWEKFNSASDVEIEARYVSYDGLTPNDTFTIANSGLHGEPSVASRGDVNDFLVVWHQDIGDDTQVRYAFCSASSVIINGTVAASSSLERRPCAAYDGIGDEYLVAYAKAPSWDGDWDVYCRKLTRLSTIGSEEAIIATIACEGSPEATMVGGANGEVLVTWDRCNGPDLFAREWFSSAAPTPPSKAASPNPSSASTNQSFSTDVSWGNGGGADSYDVYFGTDSSPDGGEFKGNQTSTSYDPGSLNPDTWYYWRIDAKNSVGTTVGDVWSFKTIQNLPSQAITPLPSDGSTGQSGVTQLSWADGGGADSYAVYFGTDSTPDAGEYQGTYTGTAFPLPTLTPDTWYYWRIDAVNAAGTTAGGVWSFKTAAVQSPASMEVRGYSIVITNNDNTASIFDGTHFGNAQVGAAVTNAFSIFNIGGHNLVLTSAPMVQITGVQASVFSGGAAPSTPVLPGHSTDFSVVFSPQATGTVSAQILIGNNDTAHDPFVFTVQGIGTDISPVLPSCDFIETWEDSQGSQWTLWQGSPTNWQWVAGHIGNVARQCTGRSLLVHQFQPIYGTVWWKTADDQFNKGWIFPRYQDSNNYIRIEVNWKQIELGFRLAGTYSLINYIQFPSVLGQWQLLTFSITGTTIRVNNSDLLTGTVPQQLLDAPYFGIGTDNAVTFDDISIDHCMARARLSMSQGAGSFQVRFDSSPATTYFLQTRPDLCLGDWLTLSTNPGNGTPMTLSHTSSVPAGFYRVLGQGQ